MNTEERSHYRSTVIELNDQQLAAVTGGDKKSGGTKTAATKDVKAEYIAFTMTEVFISPGRDPG
jgi:bacteriocin-like protein